MSIPQKISFPFPFLQSEKITQKCNNLHLSIYYWEENNTISKKKWKINNIINIIEVFIFIFILNFWSYGCSKGGRWKASSLAQICVAIKNYSSWLESEVRDFYDFHIYGSWVILGKISVKGCQMTLIFYQSLFIKCVNTIVE